MLPTGKKHRALVVLKDALVLGGTQVLVYVVDLPTADAKQGKVRSAPVTTGSAEGNLIQVIGGELHPGQVVVVQGNERLRPGQDVQIQRVVEPPAGSQPAPSQPVSEAKLR
jgi:hypothetical protein